MTNETLIGAQLAAATELRNAGQQQAACDLLVAMAAAYPESGAVQYAAACIHDFLGLEAQAVPYYVAALTIGLPDVDLRGAYLGLGSTYRTLGRYADSYQTLETGLEHFPNAPELRVFLAMAYYNLGHHHNAMQTLLRVIAETSADSVVQEYARAIRFYADDLDRTWIG
jgi:tetratricopeptide (TPR) repeat protein